MARVVQISFLHGSDSKELAGDIQALFEELSASLTPEQRAASGEWRPPMDVLDTEETATIRLDVCGVPTEALRILFRAGVVVIAGEKAPLRVAADHTYHLLERESGHFARVVRLGGAFDLANARATLRDGELTVVLPRMAERRGTAHAIPVTSVRGHA